MPHENWFLSLLRWPATPLWIVALACIVGLVRAWPAIMAKVNEARRDSAAERAQDWSRLREEIGRLSERVETLERKVKECENREDEWRRRAVIAEAEQARLEALNLGRGQAQQEAQRIVSHDRVELAEKAKREPRK